MRKIKIGLLTKIIIAILLGAACGGFMPIGLQRTFATFNALFGNFLGFFVPILIVGLIVPGIAGVGRNAARLLGITLGLAYLFTIVSGLYTWGVCEAIYPQLLQGTTLPSSIMKGDTATPYFTIAMPPILDVMSALIVAFIIGIGITSLGETPLKRIFEDLREIIMRTIARVIIPLLPLYIFGIFLSISANEQMASIMGLFMKLIVVIFAMTALLLILQFCVAGIVARRNPLKMLAHMMTAYVTALGTQSSAATIPVTLEQTMRNGVRESIAGFVIPLCATIHLSGSTLKITACALAIMMVNGMTTEPATMVGFILMLGVTMVAAPGVPGGAIMAAIGILQSILGFDQTAIGLMIALYIAMDSFGTATNVTGDGAIAVIIDALEKRTGNKR